MSVSLLSRIGCALPEAGNSVSIRRAVIAVLRARFLFLRRHTVIRTRRLLTHPLLVGIHVEAKTVGKARIVRLRRSANLDSGTSALVLAKTMRTIIITPLPNLLMGAASRWHLLGLLRGSQGCLRPAL